MPSPLVRIRPYPRISVNKLGGYLAEHKAARRLAILKAQKKELRCRVVQYQAARHAIVSSLLNPANADELLSRHIQRLQEWSPGPADGPSAAAENHACQEAIKAFIEMLPTINLAGLTAKRGSNDVPKLTKSGVVISVRPELELHGANRRGRPVVGALKLHFAKSSPLNRAAAEYVGTVLHEYGEAHLGPEACVPQHCYVIDVSTKQLYAAPSSYIQRRSDIEAACREIATLWASIPVDQ